jgi:hypothetical protein
MLVVIRQLGDDGQRFSQACDLAPCRLNVGLLLSNLTASTVRGRTIGKIVCSSLTNITDVLQPFDTPLKPSSTNIGSPFYARSIRPE